jgi:hypothetical protein
MIRTGIIGKLKSLENTIENIISFPEYYLTGYFCNDPLFQSPVLKNSNLIKFRSPEELISVSEVIIITDSPGDFNEIIRKVLKSSKHLLIFPDISLSLNQLESFIKLAEEAGVILFLYHEDLKIRLPEIIKKYFGKPEFIDIYRSLGQTDSTPQGNILEILYDEIFLVMKLNPVNPRKYFTASIPYYSSMPNFLNARIEFENGTSANVTINKFSEKTGRKIEIFRHDRMVLIHPETGELNILRKNHEKTEIFKHSRIHRINSKKEGLGQFINYLTAGNFTSDPFKTGISAHNTAIEIIQLLIPVSEKSFIKTSFPIKKVFLNLDLTQKI